VKPFFYYIKIQIGVLFLTKQEHLLRISLVHRNEQPSIPEEAQPFAQFLAEQHAENAVEAELMQQLLNYLQGKRKHFRLPPLQMKGTLFQHKVWNAIKEIPYGQTRTYAWVAQRIGHPKAARAVGQACRLNPLLLVVPCHRVVEKNGKNGGYAAGTETKQWLLDLERGQLSMQMTETEQ
jgi:methylated-DNA-[protein]-cysteine S-methyltransferase